MDKFPRAFEKLKVHEGGFVNHPKDPGGATMKGVTQRVYDAFRRSGGRATQSVRKIADAEVEAIYRKQYWDTVRADDLPAGIAYCVFDAAVNSGPAQAARWLQRCVGAGVDGVVGFETISKAKAARPVDVINSYCDMRLVFMRGLRHWPTFRKGWTRRVAEVRAQSIAWAKYGEATVTQSKEGLQASAPPSSARPGLLAALAAVLAALFGKGKQ